MYLCIIQLLSLIFLFFLVLLTQAHKFESMLNFFNIYTYLRERERERERERDFQVDLSKTT